jgi:hypothetical protein
MFTDFLLSREGFLFGSEEVSQEKSYLHIRFESAWQDIRLFPTEVPWDSAGSYPVGKILKSAFADLDMFKSVVYNCCAKHTSTCTPAMPEPSLLRLIDCRDRRIVQASRNQRYICLSYVWEQNIERISTFDAALPDAVPKTVQDAMYVAIQLDIPFLWVNRYCIDQRRPQENQNIIRNMDKIYRGAELTIIAAAGENPHHGLPGVRETPRKPQYQLKSRTCTYVAAKPGREEITRSKWGSRGW